MFDERDPQGPQPGESSRAYSAYLAYRSLPARDRTIKAAYKHQTGRENVAHVPGQWRQWATRFGWVARARAFDRDQERRRQAELVESRRTRLELRQGQARALQAKAVQALNAVPAERISPRAAIEMLRLAADLEDSAWSGTRELDAARADEELPQDGLDVLDSLKHHRELAPLLVHLNGLGVDLETHDHTGDTLEEEAP